MTPIETAAALAGPVGDLGGRFMMDPATFARAGEIDFPAGFEYYALGRLGVLGNVDPAVIAAAGVFFEPALVTTLWVEGRTHGDPMAVARHYAAACQAWGRDNLGAVPGLARIAELVEAVVTVAPAAGAPIFAGWRAMPRPDDPPGRTYQLLHVLREFRFGMHALAVLAEGLTPLEAVLAGPGGEGNARVFGWSGPFAPVSDEVRQRRAAAENRTDVLAARAFAALTDAERSELVEAVQALV